MNFRFIFVLLLCLISQASLAIDKPVIRLGVLAFGTSNWELAALEQQKSLDTANFTLEVHKLANPQTGKIALQAGAVDMIVTDWIWVARMRATGADYSFYPYSSASGALLVAKDSGIKSINDLCSKRIGIAGDELDKNWLLLQALSASSDCHLQQHTQKFFAAAPLLNQQLLDKHVDAVLNYWHFAAQLEGEDYLQILSGQQILQGLGVNPNMPNLGYVFKRSWAELHRAELAQFITLSEQARDQLCSTEATWQAVLPLLKTDNSKTQNLLRSRYCEGRIKDWSAAQLEQADKLYALLRSVSGDKLTGPATRIPADTFWFKS